MAPLYVTSPGPGQGKTAVVCGLLQLVGGGTYLRDGENGDEAFVRATLGASHGETRLIEADTPPRGEPLLAVVSYAGEATLDHARRYGDAACLVVNALPRESAQHFERYARPLLAELEPAFLGALPETRLLRRHTVAELAAYLDATVLVGYDALQGAIESYMIGAMSHIASSGLPYFSRMEMKAVVTPGNRIDIHQSALGTACQCLVLTGGFHPDPVVVERAEVEGVPVIAVPWETPETMERIGAFLETVRFRHPEKIAPMAELMQQHLDLAALERWLGWAMPTGASA